MFSNRFRSLSQTRSSTRIASRAYSYHDSGSTGLVSGQNKYAAKLVDCACDLKDGLDVFPSSEVACVDHVCTFS